MDFKIPVVISSFESFVRGACCCKRLLKFNRKLSRDVSISFFCFKNCVPVCVLVQNQIRPDLSF